MTDAYESPEAISHGTDSGEVEESGKGKAGSSGASLGALLGARVRRAVVEGAELRCDMGAAPSRLRSRGPKDEVIEGHNACDIMDHMPGVSILPFGVCRLLGGPCVPATPSPWISPTSVSLTGDSTTLIDTALLPCQVGGIIGIVDPGQATVFVLSEAGPAEVLRRALDVYHEEFAAVGRFQSSEQGLDSFLENTGIGVKGVDTAWNEKNYNCQGFADALARSLLESGVAEDARLIHFMAYRERPYWFDEQTVNHAVTEIELADGTRYLVDGQVQERSPGYQLDGDGEIPADIRDGWLLDLANRPGYDGNADYVEFGSPRDFGNAWSPDMNVTTQSGGLNQDREDRGNVDWETTWDPAPDTAP